MNALVLNIQRYSIQDGPGIRTTIFLKGCPLSCKWCSNPESQKFFNETMEGVSVAKMMDVDSILRVAERDRAFYLRSGGGITISGGEPLAHPEFTKILIRKAKEKGLNVAMETSGFQNWDQLWDTIQLVDWILFDIKHMNEAVHLEGTGVSNQKILSNIQKLSKLHSGVIARTPVIPNFNYNYDDLYEIVKFTDSIGIGENNFLPYHKYGVAKYKKLGLKYDLDEDSKVDRVVLQSWVNNLRKCFESNIRII